VIIIKGEKKQKTKSNPMYCTKKAEELINDSDVTWQMEGLEMSDGGNEVQRQIGRDRKKFVAIIR